MIEMILEVSTLDELNTIVVTTHDIEAALMIADTIWVLGHQREEETNKLIPGSTIVAEYDLIKLGLAWVSKIKEQPNFAPMVAELNSIFTKIV